MRLTIGLLLLNLTQKPKKVYDESSPMTIEKKEKIGRILWRLGCMLPLTLWPIVFYYQTLGNYNYGRHGGGPALHAVAQNIVWINLSFSLIGLILALSSRVSAERKVIAFVGIILHHIFFVNYVGDNAVGYA